MSIAFHYVNGQLTLSLSDGVYTIGKNHPNFDIIKKGIKLNDEDMIKNALNNARVVPIGDTLSVSGCLEDYIKDPSGKAEYKNGEVYFNGEVLHNAISDRVHQFYGENLPFGHLLRFIEKIYENPSYKSRRDLFHFLENKSLPVTDNGCFLTYKAITPDWKDKRTRKIDNSIGQVVYMDRKEVDDDSNIECSKGYHVGSLEYVADFGESDDIIVITRVDPRDVVSVPYRDYQKMRVCRYEVLKEFTGRLHRPLYTEKDLTEDDFEIVNPEEDYWEDDELGDYLGV